MTTSPESPEIRPYDPETDPEELWDLKQAFERALGTGTGGAEKERTYEDKLTTDYREGYLEWVARCLDAEREAVIVAAGEEGLVGYVFVLPDSFSYVWDAAVLNEFFVAEPERGTGLADRLMERAVAVVESQDLPLERLVLDVDPDNERAGAFYKRHGFEPWGELVARPIGEE
ncbi:GNAT family N-acetyltransferase [Saliphagus sp. LR7]|uniref:GNAT family N-acetyltransferase n=1 Tax=Saliphagus sp. LR7 TaxID=2282654 RepID=UPI000DF81B81|nr:GNAT family N-acetyltransferase [Saliphagus sp. LR7]